LAGAFALQDLTNSYAAGLFGRVAVTLAVLLL
jgi:hypothetical protein